MKSDEWTRDELMLAMEFFHRCPENMWTDGHPKCQEVAEEIGRSPGALDQILRNIKFVHTGIGLENASQAIHVLSGEFNENEEAFLEEAAAIRQKKGLAPLQC